VSENDLVGDNLRASTFNGVPVGIIPLTYCANLTQVGLADPTADVLNDSLGGITWTRTGVGIYEGYLDGYNPFDITIYPTILMGNTIFDAVISAAYDNATNTVAINTSQIGVGFVDGYLGSTTIEIKYYG
jgi:hypothetical protein